MELTKKDTKMIQGLSVLAMVCLHLFCRYDYQNLYQPLIFIKDLPLCFYFGQLSDFCVAGFAFCSGYSHAVMFENSDTKKYYIRRLKSLLALYLNYWLIVCVFSFVGFLVKNSTIPGSPTEFLLNFFSIRNSYNGAWWYMLVYAVLVILSPLILKLHNKLPVVLMSGIAFVLYLAGYYVRFEIQTDNWFLMFFGKFAMTYFEYLIGAIFFKYKIFTRLSAVGKKFDASKKTEVLKYIVFAALFAGMLFSHTLIIGNVIVAPFTGLAIILIFHYTKKPAFVERFFLFIGKHSTNIWLTHMFFYLVLFENLVYAAKYPVLIFTLMLIITVSVSFVLNLILELKKYLPVFKLSSVKKAD